MTGAKQAPQAQTVGYVYLVWAEGTDRYKIGSAGYPAKRLPQLQTGSPLPLQLIAEKEATDYERQERLQHQRWAKQRVQGEWFQFHPTQMPEVLAGFDLIDTFSFNRIVEVHSELGEEMLKHFEISLKEHSEAIAQFDQTPAEAHQAAYDKSKFKLKRLCQYLDKKTVLKLADEFARFDFDYDIARLKERYPKQYQIEVDTPEI
jgi:hypothetical protein